MSIFPTKILLAADGSQEAETAAATAINVAKSTNSELHVLTVGPGSPLTTFASRKWPKTLGAKPRRYSMSK